MRVIAGTARHLPLKTPEGMDTRPTTDRIKETLFNMLQSDVAGSVFVDLFSGSGGIGIEALSRGAEKAYFVENAAKAFSCIRQNLSFTKMENRAIVLKQDVCSALNEIGEASRRNRENLDIIYMDPPYGCDHEKAVLRVLKEMSCVTEDTVIIVEAALRTDFLWAEDMGFAVVREKRYKTNKHVFLRKCTS